MVEADAIKNSDQLFASMSRANLVDMLDADNELKQHLHEYSTKAAEILLVAACKPSYTLQQQISQIIPVICFGFERSWNLNTVCRIFG